MYTQLSEIPLDKKQHLIDEWIFSERNRKILKRKLLDGITHERVAEEFDMSTRRIKDIVKDGKAVILEKSNNT